MPQVDNNAVITFGMIDKRLKIIIPYILSFPHAKYFWSTSENQERYWTGRNERHLAISDEEYYWK
jgi:hypothetical protein